jgi:hypothetical protein
MMRKIALMSACLLAMACGGTAKIGGGKQGAAQAMLASSEPTQNTSSLNVVSAFFGNLSLPCDHGGEVRVKNLNLDVSAGGNSASTGMSFSAEFANCKSATSDAGDAVLNGTLSVSNLIKAGSGSALLQQTLKGKLSFGGAFNDFLDADVVQELSAGVANGPMVSMVLKGTVANSGGSYSFDESISVTGDKIVVDVTTK